MIDFPASPPSATQLADWIELNLLFADDDRVSQADIFDILDDDPDAEEPANLFRDFDWQGGTKTEEASLREEVRQLDAEGQSSNERLVVDAWQELETRAAIIGDKYPFTIRAVSVIRHRTLKNASIYAFLLMLGARLSYSISTKLVPVHEPSILFERVVRLALQSYVGGRVRRFGWPYREDGLPGNFRDAAKTLASEMYEHEGQFLTATADEKDHGLDVIAWKPFPDEHFSQLVILCQCAIGVDWQTKPVHTRLWDDIIKLAVQPVTAVAFVDLVSNHPSERMLGTSMVCGILMDRLRLAGLIRESDASEDLIKATNAWVISALPHLPEFR